MPAIIALLRGSRLLSRKSRLVQQTWPGSGVCKPWGDTFNAYPDHAWTKVLTLNLHQVFTLTQKCLPLLRAAPNKGGKEGGTYLDPTRIINESPSRTTKPTPTAPARPVSTTFPGLWAVGSDGRASLVTPSHVVRSQAK